MPRRRVRRAFKLPGARPGTMRADVREELEHHLTLSVERLIALGMTADDARAEAVRRLGDPVEQVEADLYQLASRRDRRMHVRQWIEALRMDLRDALRSLRRHPGVTAVIVGTLALGIGANAAVFPMLDRLLFRPPDGVRAPGEIRRFYIVERGDQDRIAARSVVSYPDFVNLRDGLRGMADVTAYLTSQVSVAGDTALHRRVNAGYVMPDFLPMLGVRPALGRFFVEDENRLEDQRLVAVISHRLWRSRLASDSAVIGQILEIGDRRFTIIGVTQTGFAGIDLSPVEVWLPLATQRSVMRGDGRWWEIARTGSLELVTRLRGSQPSAAAIEEAATARHAAAVEEARLTDRQVRIQLGSIIEGRGPRRMTEARRIATRLAGVSIILLLVAVANVINLLLARGIGRRREIAVRRALGVSNARLMQHFVVEAAVFALLAAGGAALGGAMLSGVVRRLLLPTATWTPPLIDPRAIAFTIVLAAGCVMVAGLAPAVHAIRGDLTRPLKNGVPGGGPRASRVRDGLLIVQAALSVVLLVGAGLFRASLERVRTADVGFDIDRIAVVNAWPAPREAYAATRARLSAMPDVEATALSEFAPLRGLSSMATFVEGRDSALSDGLRPDLNAVSSEFFATMGLAIVRGRPFEPNAGPGTALEMVVNEEAARVLWPGVDALGQCVRLGSKTNSCYVVVGIAENARRFRIVETPALQAYASLDQLGEYARALLIRSRSDPASVAAIARDDLAASSPRETQPTTFLYRDWLEPQLRPWRLGAQLFTAVASLSLVLAVVGLYAMLSYSVAERSREIGVRIALGARQTDIVAVVARHAMIVLVLGLTIGLAVAAAAGKGIAALLYDTSPRDPRVYLAVSATLLVAGLVAAIIPAVRAGRVDPLEALRAE